MKDHETLPMIPIRSRLGASWLEDYDGKRYLDAISSWWVNLFGHANRAISAAIARAARRARARDARRLHARAGGAALPSACSALAPRGLTRCFYADSGSAAVEVALKMSFHYWRNRGRGQAAGSSRLPNSYHGETLGALAVGNVALYREIYRPLLMDVITRAVARLLPARARRELGSAHAAHVRRDGADARRSTRDETCAVIVEPLVQCAGSMRMYHPVYLESAARRVRPPRRAPDRRRDRGRASDARARSSPASRRGITPDFLCLSKGLTGGYLPLSVVLTDERCLRARSTTSTRS